MIRKNFIPKTKQNGSSKGQIAFYISSFVAEKFPNISIAKIPWILNMSLSLIKLDPREQEFGLF